MINPISRTKGWILESCNRNSIKDPTLLEKTVNRFGEIEERDCSMEIIKQLFDVASLFDRIDDLTIARETFEKIAPIELEYRGMDKENLDVILDDIYKTSELICTGLYTNDKSFEYQQLTKGIKRIQSLIISENYNHYSAIVNASKAAYLAILLKKGINEVKHYSPEIDLRALKVEAPLHPAINKIKSFRPEAFFYWTEIQKLNL